MSCPRFSPEPRSEHCPLYTRLLNKLHKCRRWGGGESGGGGGGQGNGFVLSALFFSTLLVTRSPSAHCLDTRVIVLLRPGVSLSLAPSGVLTCFVLQPDFGDDRLVRWTVL